jgi:CheY-like chemotaxis protein
LWGTDEVPEQVWVLLAEDEFLIAEVVEDALVSGGYVVQRVASGDSALVELDGAKHFSGLVTDIRLRGQITGWEVARHARRVNPDIAVIYVSGDSAHAYEAEGVPHSTFVQKPFVPDQITTAISTLLNERPQ